MLIEYVAPDYYHVDLADIFLPGQAPGAPAARSFASSEQLIAFIKNNAPLQYVAGRRGTRGVKLQPTYNHPAGALQKVSGQGNSNYSLANGDIIIQPDARLYYDEKTQTVVEVHGVGGGTGGN